MFRIFVNDPAVKEELSKRAFNNFLNDRQYKSDWEKEKWGEWVMSKDIVNVVGKTNLDWHRCFSVTEGNIIKMYDYATNLLGEVIII